MRRPAGDLLWRLFSCLIASPRARAADGIAVETLLTGLNEPVRRRDSARRVDRPLRDIRCRQRRRAHRPAHERCRRVSRQST